MKRELLNIESFDFIVKKTSNYIFTKFQFDILISF